MTFPLMPVASHYQPFVYRKGFQSLSSPGLTTNNATIILQASGSVVPTLPAGMTNLTAVTFSYSVTSNNGETTSNGSSAYRISFGMPASVPLSVNSYQTNEIFSQFGEGPITIGLAATGTTTYTPTERFNPIGYVAIAYAGNTSNTPISAITTTINGIGPTISRSFVTSALNTIVAGVNTRSGYAKITYATWQGNYGNNPVDILIGNAQAIFVISKR